MLIALSARKRHGKDTTADYICKQYGCVKYALASPFKDGLASYLSKYITRENIEGSDGFDREEHLNIPGDAVVQAYKNILRDHGYFASEYNIEWDTYLNTHWWSIRKLMTTIGTDIGVNQVDKLIWMHPLIQVLSENENVVVSDCRQEHEMVLMRKFGAIVMHIINPHITDTDTHITERGLAIIDGDKVIQNRFDSSWSVLKQKMAYIELTASIKASLHESTHKGI